MGARLTSEHIREFWTQQARKHGPSPAASWSDVMVVEMEIREIMGCLEDGDNILDVGCANGYSTVQFALHKKVTIRGVDYVPEMIENAHLQLEGVSDQLRGTVEFVVGDVTKLDDPTDTYDKVIVTRVIINLQNWERQLVGLSECARVLKPGGKLLLAEATLQGWRRMNQFRREWGLPDIPIPAFNQYLDEENIVKALSPHCELIELANFSSTYYVGTRVLKPLLAKATGANVAIENPNMEWNRWLAQLPAWGDYGVQKLFIFRKH